jgi:hypothetical protein
LQRAGGERAWREQPKGNGVLGAGGVVAVGL